MKLHPFVLALGLLCMAGLTACGEVATPTTIPTAAPTVAATATTTAPTVGATETVAAPALSTATTAAPAAGTATSATGAATPASTASAAAPATPFSTPTEAAMMGTPAAGTPAAGGTPTLSDPRQVVQDFLTSLQSQPDGSTSLAYLSDYQQLRVAAGKPIASLLGIQNMYQSFTVGDAQMSGTTSATVRTTLNYATGNQVRDFTLNNDNGAWTINSVTPVQSSK